MSFGFFLKQAGYDHVIIQGKSENPIYLTIEDDHIEIRNAEKIWNKDIVKATDLLRKIHGECGIISIGQAGENLVKSSIALIDKISTFGRGGLGAVMGYKKLKAIVSKGTKGIKIHNPKKFLKIYKQLFNRIRTYPHRDSWIELGMLRSLPVGMILTARGQRKKAKQCNERTYLKKVKQKRIACPSCPMGDKDILKLDESENKKDFCFASSVINPFLMLTLEDLNTYEEALKAFDLTNRYGLDSLTMTSLLEFLVDNKNRGELSEKDILLDLQKDFPSLLKVIELVAYRKGFGDLLAEGWDELATRFPKLRNNIPAIKGLDVIFEPRLLRLGTMEFEQVVNPKGAHVASGGSPTYIGASGSIKKFKSHFNRMGIPSDAIRRIFQPPLEEMVINIARLTRYAEDWYTILTSQGICARAQMNRFYSLDLVKELYNSVTGFLLEKEDIRKSAERTWNLMKILNLNGGFSRKDDYFPSVWFDKLKYDNISLELRGFFNGTLITPEIAEKLISDYYEERGWDIFSGTPTQEKLGELNLGKYLK